MRNGRLPLVDIDLDVSDDELSSYEQNLLDVAMRTDSFEKARPKEMRSRVLSHLDRGQQVALAKWLLFSFAFGLSSYFLVMFEAGFNARALLGDGSLVLVGLSLVVAAGSAAFDDIGKIKSHWMWFGICAVALLLTAGAYAKVRTDIRAAEAAVDRPIPSLRQSLARDALDDDVVGGEVYSEEHILILAEHLAVYEDALRDSSQVDAEHAVGEEGAREALLALLAAEEAADDRRIAAEGQLDYAHWIATAAGVGSSVFGLLLGAAIVLVVSRGGSRRDDVAKSFAW